MSLFKNTKDFFGGYSLEQDILDDLIIKESPEDYSNNSNNVTVNCNGRQQAMVPINNINVNINIDKSINKDTLEYIFDRIEKIVRM